MLNDLRRRYRTRRQLVFLISDVKDLTRSKIQSVQTNIEMIQANHATDAPIMKFPIAALKAHHLQVVDLLNANKNQAINALLYWMEAIDDLLDEARQTSARLRVLSEEDASNDIRERLAARMLEQFTDARGNLETLMTLCSYYEDGHPHKILEHEQRIDLDVR